MLCELTDHGVRGLCTVVACGKKVVVISPAENRTGRTLILIFFITAENYLGNTPLLGKTNDFIYFSGRFRGILDLGDMIAKPTSRMGLQPLIIHKK